MWQVYSYDASELKPIKNFGEKGAWAYPGSPGLPILSQERVKLRTLDFVHTFIGSITTKAHEKVGKSSRGHSQGVSKIYRAPIYGAQLSCYLCFTFYIILYRKTSNRSPLHVWLLLKTRLVG